MSLVGNFQGVLNEFELCANAHCTVNRVTPKAKQFKFRPKQDNILCQELTFDDSLRITMDVAPSTPFGKYFPTVGLFEIFINPYELYFLDRAKPKIVKTTTEVAYVFDNRKGDKSANLILGLHYDYEVFSGGEPGECHPTYHAQITSDLFHLTPKLVSRGININNALSVPFLRIPTAHMSLISVLLGVAADCFNTENFEKFVKWVRNRDAHQLHYDDTLHTRIKGRDNSFCASSWYRNC